MDRPTPRNLRAAPAAADDEWRDPLPAPMPPAAAAPEPDPEPTDEDSLIARLRAGTGRVGLDKLRIKVFRRARGSADLEFCGDYLPSEFEAMGLEGLRDAWGAGSYEIRAIGPRGIAMREQVSLARREQLAQAQPAPQLDGLAQVLAQLAQGQARIVEALSQRPDPQASMRDTLALMTAMREAMGLNIPPPPPAPAMDPTAMLSGIVGAVRQLREVSAELSPPAADPESPMALLPQVLDLVKVGMEARQAPQVPQLAMPASLDAAPVPPPVLEPEPDVEEPMQLVIMRALLARVLWRAKRNASPEVAAEDILDHAPDDLLAELAKPTWWDTLAAVAPALVPHRPWVEQVRALVLAWLAEDDADEPPADLAATPKT